MSDDPTGPARTALRGRSAVRARRAPGLERQQEAAERERQAQLQAPMNHQMPW